MGNIVSCDPFGEDVPSLGEAVLVMGIFDGLHVGHRTIFSMARDRADELGLPLVAVTFGKDPDEIFRADDPAFSKLLSNDDRLEMLAELSDTVLSLPASEEMFAMSPEDFLAYLESVSHPRAIFTGSNYRYGSRASGTAQDLARWAQERGYQYVACDLVEEEGDAISSTRIRKDLRQGKVAMAKHMLAGRPHAICGTVVHGRGQGGGFGFATANLDVSQCEAMLPREGVYGAYAVVDGKRYSAAVNVGTAKSFEEATALIEAHLLDFEGDLYGKCIRIEFEEWLREPRVFETKEELIQTVIGNIDWVREHLGGR